jgi:predicted RNA-binding Zn ribbon-like protein
MDPQTGGAAQPPFDPDSPFTYVGGESVVDFVNTVDWTSRGLEVDRFTGYPRLLQWALGAGVIGADTADRLAVRAAANPRAAAAAMREAVALRGVLERLFRALTAGDDPTTALAELNDGLLRRAACSLALVAADGGEGATLALGWPAMADALDLPLLCTAWGAAQFLASADVQRLRRCSGTDCGWYYVDRSRNGLRRWCAMETCGTREKSRRRASRRTDHVWNGTSR